MSELIILEDDKKSLKTDISKKADANKSLDFMWKVNDFFLSFQKISIKQKVLFYRLTSVMLNSWITLMKAIIILEKQEKNVLMKNMLKVFLEKLKEWKTLSDCLELYNASFAESEVWMIRSWEKTWKLNETLVNMAEQVEKISSIVWKLKAALMYPAMIMIVVIWVIAVMMIMVVPKLLEIFTDKSNLPASTQTLIVISDFFKYYWWLVIIMIVGIYIWLWVFKKTEYWAYYLDDFKIRIPKFWEIYKRYLLSKFARTFSSLITAWVSVVEALKICSTAIWNEVYRQRILLLTEDVKQW